MATKRRTANQRTGAYRWQIAGAVRSLEIIQASFDIRTGSARRQLKQVAWELKRWAERRPL